MNKQLEQLKNSEQLKQSKVYQNITNINNEFYYFPKINRIRERYQKDFFKFDGIDKMIDLVENEYQKEKDENDSKIKKENSNLINLIEFKKNKIIEKKNKLCSKQQELLNCDHTNSIKKKEYLEQIKKKTETVSSNNNTINQFQRDTINCKKNIKTLEKEKQKNQELYNSNINQTHHILNKEQKIFQREMARIKEKNEDISEEWDNKIEKKIQEKNNLEIEIEKLELNAKQINDTINKKKKINYKMRKQMININNKMVEHRKKTESQVLIKMEEIKQLEDKIKKLENSETNELSEFDSNIIKSNHDNDIILNQKLLEIESITKEIDDLSNSISQYSREPQNVSTDNQEVSYKLQKLVKKMKSLKRKKKDMDNSLNVLMNDMMSQMKVNESDRNSVAQNNQTLIRQDNKKLVRLRKELTELQQPSNKLIEEEKLILDKIKQETSGEKKQFEEINQKIKLKKRELDIVLFRKKELVYHKQKLLDRLDYDFKRAEIRLQKMTERTEAKQNLLSTNLDDSKIDFENRYLEYKNKLDRLNLSRIELEKENNRIKNEVSHLEKQILNLSKTKPNLDYEIFTLQEEIESLDNSITKYQKQLEEAKTNINDNFKLKEIDYFIKIQELRKLRQDEDLRLFNEKKLIESKKQYAVELLSINIELFNKVIVEIAGTLDIVE